MPGYSLRIFLVDGAPDGLRIVTKSNWNGVVAVAARSRFPEVLQRDEFKATGVYLLLGADVDSGVDRIYVGEGDSIATRISIHYKEKDWWDQAVAVSKSGQSLDKADIRFLEAELVRRAKANGLVMVDNGQTPQPPSPSDADAADLETFLLDVLSILPVLGIRALEGSNSAKNTAVDALTLLGGVDLPPELTLKVTGVNAKGFSVADGFVVRAGSVALPPKVSIKPGVKGLREALEASGKLIKVPEPDGSLMLTSDVKFRSPSQAASVIYGTNINGREYWVDSGGSSINELESASAVDVAEKDEALNGAESISVP